MHRSTVVITSLLTAGSLMLPLSAQAADDSINSEYGLIDYKMGIAPPPMPQSPGQSAMISPNPSITGGGLDEYGIADLKSGTAQNVQTSDNSDSLPVSEMLKDSVGLAQGEAATMPPGAVVTADGGAIGMIERIVPGTTRDTVYVRVSNTIADRTVSLFRIDVPKGAAQEDGILRLGYTMSNLLDILDAQA